MSGVSVTFTGLRERLQTLDRLEREQLPFAAAVALTKTAQEVQKALVEDMRSAFDRPTRATLDSTYVQPATREKMEARVWIKDGRNQSSGGSVVGTQGAWGKGNAASKWLTPQVYGGQRQAKGVERMLRRRGTLGADQYIMPGQGMKLDAHGNIPRGQLNKILSGAQQFTQEGYNANATGSKRSQAKGNGRSYFVMYDTNRKPMGIAERTGRGSAGLRMLLVFARKPSYSKGMDWFGTAEKTARQALPVEFDKAMARAVATRRSR